MIRVALPAALALALAIFTVQPANAAAGHPTWAWPSSAQDAALQKSVVEADYSAKELRNIRNTLDTLSHQGELRGQFVAPGGVTTRNGFAGLYEIYGGVGFTPRSVGDRQDHVEEIIAKGDRVWVIWTIDGHHTGDLFGFPGSGKPMHVREMALFLYNEDGLRTKATFYADDMALYTQGGGKVEFPRPPPAAR